MTKYLLGLLILISCNSQNNTKESSKKKEYSNVVGDIKFDARIDSNFIRCDSFSNQYYGKAGGLSYKGEFFALKEELFNAYNSIGIQGQTGLFTIRFIVNCKGDTGMFRTYSTDLELNEFNFDHRITTQLLNATKALNKWEVTIYEGQRYDYYQYLTFKIIDSELKDIAP